MLLDEDIRGTVYFMKDDNTQETANTSMVYSGLDTFTQNIEVKKAKERKARKKLLTLCLVNNF